MEKVSDPLILGHNLELDVLASQSYLACKQSDEDFTTLSRGNRSLKISAMLQSLSLMLRNSRMVAPDP